MGPSSQSRKSSAQKAREINASMAGDPKQKKRNVDAQKKQTAIDGKKPNTKAVDYKTLKLVGTGDHPKGTYMDAFGNTLVCKKCAQINNPGYHKAHQRWCPRSQYYGKGQLELDAMERKRKGDEIIRANSKKPSKMTKAATAKFFAPRKRDQPVSPAKDSNRPQIGESPYEKAIAEEIEAANDPTPSNNLLPINLEIELATDETPPNPSDAPVESTAPIVEKETNPAPSIAPQLQAPVEPTAATINAPMDPPIALEVPTKKAPPPKSVVNPYRHPTTYDFNPKDIKDVLQLGLAKPKPAKLAMPISLHHVVSHISTCSPQLRGESNELVAGDRAKKMKMRMDWWRRNFGVGNIKIVVPRDVRGPSNPNPNPQYHMLEGVEIYWVRWDLAFPSLKLSCWEGSCDGTMVRSSKMDLNKPSCHIANTSGARMVAFTVDYKCNKCNNTCAGTDTPMLHSLPSYCSSQFPVEAECSKPNTRGQGRLQLSNIMTRQFKSLGIAHVPSSAFAQLSREMAAEMYTEAVADYYSQLEGWTCGCVSSPDCTCEPEYPSLNDWLLGAPYPTQKNVLDTFTRAFYDTHTRSGLSEYQRTKRELQAVTPDYSFAYDHTFDFVNNYSGEVRNGANAVLTCLADTGEVCGVWVVPDTKMNSSAHALEQMARRPNFKPIAYWCDNYPANKAFLEELFHDIKGHLGLFHMIQNITRTLKMDHKHHKLACKELSECFTYADKEDREAVLTGLRDGTVGRGGPKTADEITEMENNGTFKKNYRHLIRRHFYSKDTAIQNLNGWKIKYKVSHSKDKLPGLGQPDQLTGKTLFSKSTSEVINATIKKLDNAIPKVPPEALYRIANAPPKSKNDLKRYSHVGNESRTEAMHEVLHHLGNTGMKKDTTDACALWGLTRYNARQRFTNKLGEMPREVVGNIPWHLREAPTFYNHSNLAAINLMARNHGRKTDFFPDLITIGEDNGEAFLSDYYFEQKAREGRAMLGINSPRCQCERCANNPKEISGQPLILEPIPVPQPEPVVPPVAAAMPAQAPLEPITRYVAAPMASQPQVPMIAPGAMVPMQQPMAPLMAQMWMALMQQQQQFAMPVQPAAALAAPQAPPSQYCCKKFGHWSEVTKPNKGNKAGRAPHDQTCPNHSSQKKKNTF